MNVKSIRKLYTEAELESFETELNEIESRTINGTSYPDDPYRAAAITELLTHSMNYWMDREGIEGVNIV